MSAAVKCDRCGVFDTLKALDGNQLPDKWQRLDYWSSGIGHYHTIHLCTQCAEAHRKFLVNDR